MLEPDPNPSPEDNYCYSTHSVSTFESDSGIVFVLDGKNVISHVGKAKAIKNSLNEAVSAFTDYSSSLYVVSSAGCILVSDSVTDFYISPLGDSVYFYRESSVYQNKTELCRFSVKPADFVIIDISEYFVSPEKSIISSDGKAFLYYKNYSIGTSDTCYLSKNGNEGIMTDCIGTADSVSGDGKYIIWHDERNRYFIRSNGKDVAIETDLPSTVKVNIRCDEVLYSVSCGGTYLIRNGGKPEKISNETVYSLCYPENVLKNNGTVAMVNSFKMKLYTSSASLSSLSHTCYITSRFDDTVYKSLSLMGGSYVSYNMSLIYAVDKSGSLYKLNRNKPDLSGEIDTDVLADSLVMSNDGKKIYYSKTDGSLWCLSGGKSTPITDATENYYITKNGSVYIITDGELYFSTGGKPSLTDVELSEDFELFSVSHNVFLLSDNVLYILDGKGKSSVLAKNIIGIAQ